MVQDSEAKFPEPKITSHFLPIIDQDTGRKPLFCRSLNMTLKFFEVFSTGVLQIPSYNLWKQLQVVDPTRKFNSNSDFDQVCRKSKKLHLRFVKSSTGRRCNS